VVLQEKRVAWPVSWPLSLAALSVAGCPLLVGFGAKAMVLKSLSGGFYLAMMLASVGTAALMMRLLIFPRKREAWNQSTTWQAPLMLCIPLVFLGLFGGPYDTAAWLKAGGPLVAGGLLHQFALKRLMRVRLSQDWEKLEHVVGLTCLVLVVLLVIGDFR
jgi:multicomponent Na+:H+ antiporter subunit D